MSENMITDPETSKAQLFNKDQLEYIVEQRLSRERKNNESLEKIREIVAILRKKEAFKKMSNAAIADKLYELAGEVAEKTQEPDSDGGKAEPELCACDERPAETPMSNDVTFAATNAEESKVDGGKYDYESDRRKRELSDFLLRYGEDRLLGVLNDRAFGAFCSGKNGDIVTLYESFCAFLDALSSSPEAKRRRAAQRDLASTGFSGGASCAVDYGSLLTENQKRIAKAAGMSYRQYSELISQIPAKKL